MTLQMMIPLWATILLVVPMLAMCIAGMVTRPRQRFAWARRALMVLLIAAVAVRPSTPIAGEETQRMNGDVFFVVDQTGSMRAEDYDGGKPRLDGVKHDMEQILQHTKGSRYSIIGYDSTATSQLPLTTDAGAVQAWISTLDTELTDQSKGSNTDRPRDVLLKALTETQRENPDDEIIVYLLSDGENTDGKKSQTFAAASQFIDAGAVLGYGTDRGGPMKRHGGKNDGSYLMSSGGRALSTIDRRQLQEIAGQLKVPYLHRTAPDAAQDRELEKTLSGIHLKAVPTKRASYTDSYEDWYWIPAIALAILFAWELGMLMYRLPTKLFRLGIREGQ